MKINMIPLNNAQLPATSRCAAPLNLFSLLAGTLLRKSEASVRSVCAYCAASQQFNLFNSQWQTSAARRHACRRAMTTSNPFGGAFMVGVGKRCLHTYPTYPDR